MFRQFSAKRIVSTFITDLFGTLFALLLAAWLRLELGTSASALSTWLSWFEQPVAVPWWKVNLFSVLPLPIVGMVVLIWSFFLTTLSAYDGSRNETLKAELLNVFLAVCVSTLALTSLLYFTFRDTPRGIWPIFFVLDLTGLLGIRVALWVYRFGRTDRLRSRRRGVLVVGAGTVGQQAVEQLQKYAWSGLQFVGYVDDDLEKQSRVFSGLRVLGNLDRIAEIVAAYEIKHAVIALPLHAHERLVETCRALQRLSVNVHVVPDLFALSFPNATLDGFGGIPVIYLGQPSIYGWRRFVKRAFDVTVVSVGLMFIWPFLLIIALLIRLDSPGPILYRQKRIGENGRPFEMLKFRSMQVDSDPGLHRAHMTRLIKDNLELDQLNHDGNGHKPNSLKMAEDPRVTQVGRLIRQTSLDELPQLFNVLRGEMSLVGPRPPVAYEVELYKDWHKQRLMAIPGMTGLWQVRGRNRVSFDEMVRMDLDYIKNQSLWLDILILLQTPLAVITGQGAG